MYCFYLRSSVAFINKIIVIVIVSYQITVGNLVIVINIMAT